jgi:hypothetical protein
MRRIKTILLIGWMAASAITCIRPYIPEIEAGEESKYVISGCLNSLAGEQSIYISVTSPIGSPEYIPLSYCTASIADNNGNIINLQESEPGKYSAWIGQDYLQPGTAYRLRVETPSGDIITSDYDTMPPGPPIDSVYFIVEDHPTSSPSSDIRGLQFYVDLDATGYSSRYYRWEVNETWEYRAAHVKENYYDGSFHAISPPDSSLWVCWSHVLIHDIFTISTASLAQNSYYRYPLHFIDGSSARLSVLYSILLRQYSMSERAYNYWERLRVNSNEQGGLYEKQPVAVEGNVMNESPGGKQALGLFYAATVSEKRVFITKPEELELGFFNFCNEESLGHFGWAEYGPKEYPVYYYFPQPGGGGVLILSTECVDCTLQGGTTEKPDFWPY